MDVEESPTARLATFSKVNNEELWRFATECAKPSRTLHDFMISTSSLAKSVTNTLAIDKSPSYPVDWECSAICTPAAETVNNIHCTLLLKARVKGYEKVTVQEAPKGNAQVVIPAMHRKPGQAQELGNYALARIWESCVKGVTTFCSHHRGFFGESSLDFDVKSKQGLMQFVLLVGKVIVNMQVALESCDGTHFILRRQVLPPASTHVISVVTTFQKTWNDLSPKARIICHLMKVVTVNQNFQIPLDVIHALVYNFAVEKNWTSDDDDDLWFQAIWNACWARFSVGGALDLQDRSGYRDGVGVILERSLDQAIWYCQLFNGQTDIALLAWLTAVYHRTPLDLANVFSSCASKSTSTSTSSAPAQEKPLLTATCVTKPIASQAAAVEKAVAPAKEPEPRGFDYKTWLAAIDPDLLQYEDTLIENGFGNCPEVLQDTSVADFNSIGIFYDDHIHLLQSNSKLLE